MTDRLEEIAAGLVNGGIDYPTFADVEWLIAEVRALRQRHAAAVRFGYDWDRDHRDLMYDHGKAAVAAWQARKAQP